MSTKKKKQRSEVDIKGIKITKELLIAMGAEVESPGSSLLTLTTHDMKVSFWMLNHDPNIWTISFPGGPHLTGSNFVDLLEAFFKVGFQTGVQALKSDFKQLMGL
jgi:hypothetical protein